MKTKTVGTQTHSDFKPGDVVRLVHAQGCTAPAGIHAVVVRPEEFPAYFTAMCKTIDVKDVYEHFVAVQWICTVEEYEEKGFTDGFYSKARFERVENVAKG